MLKDTFTFSLWNADIQQDLLDIFPKIMISSYMVPNVCFISHEVFYVVKRGLLCFEGTVAQVGEWVGQLGELMELGYCYRVHLLPSAKNCGCHWHRCSLLLHNLKWEGKSKSCSKNENMTCSFITNLRRKQCPVTSKSLLPESKFEFPREFTSGLVTLAVKWFTFLF